MKYRSDGRFLRLRLPKEYFEKLVRLSVALKLAPEQIVRNLIRDAPEEPACQTCWGARVIGVSVQLAGGTARAERPCPDCTSRQGIRVDRPDGK